MLNTTILFIALAMLLGSFAAAISGMTYSYMAPVMFPTAAGLLVGGVMMFVALKLLDLLTEIRDELREH